MGLESAFLEYVMCYLLLNSNAIPEISTIKSCPIIVRSSWFSTHLCKINLPSMSGDVSTLSRVNIEEIFENRYCVYARRQNSKRFVWSLVTASQFPCLLDKMADETVTRSIVGRSSAKHVREHINHCWHFQSSEEHFAFTMSLDVVGAVGSFTFRPQRPQFKIWTFFPA